MNRAGWIIFGFFCTGVAGYALGVTLSGNTFSLLQTKTAELLANQLWQVAFYTHVIGGGLSLLTGWSQFSTRLRNTRMNLHRNLGKAYVGCVLLSGTAGLYIAFHATGGIIAQTGFTFLAITWLSTTILALQAVRKGNIRQHQLWMTYSFAACFAAVTLRIYLPLLTIALGDFFFAYRIIAWLCWVPNILVAWRINQRTAKLV